MRQKIRFDGHFSAKIREYYCFSKLRHQMNSISDRATLEKAYQETIYEIFFPAFHIHIGAFHPHLDEFLVDNSAYTWAFVSAYNPYSQVLNASENQERHQHLQAYLENENYLFCEGEGRHPEGNWTPERSVFILGISLEKAIAVAAFFQQNAIVFGSVNQKARLVWCS